MRTSHPMRVLVTGGAGYIGSVVCEELDAVGHAVIALDDLSQGHAEAVHAPARLVVGDLRDRSRVLEVLREERIDAVVHLAASSIVSESMVAPAAFYANNVEGSLLLLEAMREAQVERLVFSSTAAVYAGGASGALAEDDRLDPANPYGETKLAIERALRWYAHAYGLSAVSLRYFNAAGASARCGERHDPETHLIPRVLDVAASVRAGKSEEIEVYGDDYETPDGSCIRDYVHVLDLARAHVLALESASTRGVASTYNLGAGEGRSVRQVIAAAEDVTGVKLPVRVKPRRPGDPARLVASISKAREQLGWRPTASDLATIVASAWAFRSGTRT